MTRLRRATLLAFGAFFPLSWILAASTATAIPRIDPAMVGPKTITVSDSTEAWYASLPLPVDLCATPLGCVSVPVPLPSIYPADTLHAGVALGAETARSYVKPDLEAVPAGSKIVEATMTLPVAASATDGSLQPEAAKLLACPATQLFNDGVDGALTLPPRVDCHHAPALKYDATQHTFTVDVTNTFVGWASGQPENGIAIVPDVANVAPTDLWHVTFDGHKRAGTPHIKTSVMFDPPSSPPATDAGVTNTPAPAPTEAAAPPPVVLPDEGVVPPVAPAPVVAPTTAQPVAFVKHFKYPMAFLFPIALLALGVFLTRLFTGDATPVKR
ncbi:MAG TPA: hypothetical protein VHD81_08090 [Mycobacteriales bacterium]|nr:hypothetical protein [Mycobacteriales bacterium]